MAMNPKKGGSEAEDFFARAAAHTLKPTIVNEKSNFVVVTYWWGRGNLNKNTQRPCPEEREEIIQWEGIKTYLLEELRESKPNATAADIPQADIDRELKAALKAYKMEWKEPKKFEAMIQDWEDSCRSHKCNFLGEEYPEFAVKGGYQHAINFKPYFIDLALQACYPRSVLYIDGDMLIKKYPGVFDLKDVDYMARGWNSDPRAAPFSQPCFDPYTFETSGGTMFFANTFYGRRLLKYWQSEVLKYPGKADDRILAFAIMKKHLLAGLSSIQVPIEFLWLSLDYDIMAQKYKMGIKESAITITHPECLTGEERAEKDSNIKSSRIPPGYTRAVENNAKCRDKESLYEYVYFDEKDNIGAFREYFDWLDKNKVITVVPFSNKYGKHNAVATENSNLFQSIQLQVHDMVVLVSENTLDSSISHKVNSKRELTPTILKYLLNKQHVVYVPRSTRSVRTVVGKAVEEHLDLVTRNMSDKRIKAKKEYTLKLDPTYPVYFGPNNKVLRHLLLMSSSIEDLENIFDESYVFLTRIHCGWL